MIVNVTHYKYYCNTAVRYSLNLFIVFQKKEQMFLNNIVHGDVIGEWIGLGKDWVLAGREMVEVMSN